MRIIITGAVGTGKTSVARIVSKKLKLPLVELSDADVPFAYNKKLKTREVKVKDLRKWARNKTAGLKDYAIEGHMACELDFPADFVFVLRTHPDELAKRLIARRYHKEKIIENIMAEALDYCSCALKQESNVFEIDTTGKTAARSAGEILKALKGRKKGKIVSWSSWLSCAVCPRN